ncbi:MAG: hypothetical protein J5925_02665 [Clostridia bacterium]|nr:hypothetical protein [Clostridia bacterium]
MEIDITFDFRSDSKGKDPDLWSPTLKAYQRFLYSKPLPNGEIMQLDENLVWKDFKFSSDSILHGFTNWKSYRHIISRADKSLVSDYVAYDYTIGGELIFPCNHVDGVQTINQARGINHKIRDRIDLTLECIRRFYLGEESPLYPTLNAYKPFFDLFVDFEGYVSFFFLQDLVENNCTSVKFLCRFDDFNSNYPLPETVEEYNEYIKKVMQFNNSRNARISAWCKRVNK